MADEKTTTLQLLFKDSIAVTTEARFIADMSPIAADAMVKVAEATYSKPARQETARTGIITGAIFVLTIIGALIAPPDKATTIITTGLVVLGGAWGIAETAKRLRKPPAT